MLKFLRILACLPVFMAGYFYLSAQIETPSKWSFSLSKNNAKIGEEIDFIARVKLDNTWYLYGSGNDMDPDLGPTVTVFVFKASPSFKLSGKLKSIGAHKHFDDVFGGDVSTFDKIAEFRQKIKITGKNPVIEGTYEGQVCTSVNGRCIPVSGDFKITDLKVLGDAGNAAKPNEINPANPASSANPKAELANKDGVQTSQKDSISAEAKSALQNPDSVSAAGSADKTAAPGEAATTSGTSANAAAPVSVPQESLLTFLLAAFGAGLIALTTPCVYPMIPMTVSFFTRSYKSRSQGIFMALFYGFSIIAIYTLIGTIVAKFNGPEAANFLSTHWIPNLLFFGIFIVFALSFLGMFEIELPSSWVNGADRQADKGGFYGVFFMAFTLALVSFSCTGPFVGTLLVQSAGGAVLKPIIGMFGFSLAFAIPFTLFAVFPEYMQRLPKSGGWLNSVKVVLGFLELALAFKFLSIADQAYHWHLLDREVFIAIWIAVFTLLGFYLLGKLRMPLDSPMTHIPVPRLVMATAVFSFVIYLVPGMFGAPLKALAGYLPPEGTIDFNLSAGQGSGSVPAKSNLCDSKVRFDFLSPLVPKPYHAYFDLKEALACAKTQGKPVFIDFTGHGCVNCREMESRVWSDERVKNKLSENYVMAALYVDDKTELPEKEWYVSKYDGKQKTSLGKQNADLQITRFNANAQPLYVLLTPEGEILVPPHAYDLDADTFVKFLDSGTAEMNKRKKAV